MQKKMYRCNDELFPKDIWVQDPDEIVLAFAKRGFYPFMIEGDLGNLQKIETGEYTPVPASPDRLQVAFQHAVSFRAHEAAGKGEA